MGRVPLTYVPHYCGEKNWVGNTHYMPHTIIVTRKIRTERNASENISHQRVSIEASIAGVSISKQSKRRHEKHRRREFSVAETTHITHPFTLSHGWIVMCFLSYFVIASNFVFFSPLIEVAVHDERRHQPLREVMPLICPTPYYYGKRNWLGITDVYVWMNVRGFVR